MSILIMFLRSEAKCYTYQFWCQNMAGKCGANMDLREGMHPSMDHTYQGDVHVLPLVGDGPCWTVIGMWKIGGVTRWRAGMSCSTSSQLCASWYLPRFLFRGGSLTLMNMASLMVLVMPWDSLSTMKKLQLDGVTILKSCLYVVAIYNIFVIYI